MFDEVITGFRVGLAGAQGAFGIDPRPLDLRQGRRRRVCRSPRSVAAPTLMDELAPLGPVYQAGTLSGNPLATAAGLAVLSQLDDGAYADLTVKATRLAEGLRSVCTDAGRAAQVVRVGTLTGLFFTDAPVHDYAAAQAADHDAYARFFHAMLERGVFLPPSGYEALFVSLAHGGAEIEHILDAAHSSLTVLALPGRQ